MSFETRQYRGRLLPTRVLLRENVMRNFDKALWAVVAVLGAMVLMVFVSHAKAPDKVAGSTSQSRPLKPPNTGKINVAFIISDSVDVMDIAGPWEVFSDAMLTSNGKQWHDSDGDDPFWLRGSSGLHAVSEIAVAVNVLYKS